MSDERPDGTARDGSLWDQLNGLPAMDDDPVQWDPRQGAFVPRSPASPAPDVVDPTTVMRAPPRPTPDRPAAGGPPPVRAQAPAQVQPRAAAPVRQPVAPPVGPHAPQPGGPGGTGRPPTRTAPRRRRRHPWLFRIGVLLLPLLVLFVGVVGVAWWQFNQIERVDVSAVLTSGAGGTNYLIVGTDSRAGIVDGDPNSDAFLGDGTEGIEGSRTDTIMLLRTQGDQSLLMSIPRDLWVTNPATGEPGRINATFRSGPANLITAVESLGVPVDHYMEINFVSFGDLVDAVGGITVDVPYPARDTRSGLSIAEAGTVTLQGEQALAYVRSRYYEELIDGQWVSEGTGDLGRVTRQQQFLQGLLSEAGSVRNPMTAIEVVGALSVGLRIDDTISFFDAIGLAWTFGHLDLETVELPTTPRTTSGGAEVLELREPDAGLALSRMGTPAPDAEGEGSGG